MAWYLRGRNLPKENQNLSGKPKTFLTLTLTLETPVLTQLQQTVVDGYPRPHLPLFRNSRSSSCSSVFGAIFRELFDFEGDMRLTYTV